MADPPSPDGGLDPRRSYSRLRLGIGARLETLEGRQMVRLIDLSQGGAHLILNRPEPIKEGVLTWLRFDCFGVAAWQREDHVGLKFDRLIPLPFLVETRKRAPSVVREEEMGTEMAQAWVSGELSDD